MNTSRSQRCYAEKCQREGREQEQRSPPDDVLHAELLFLVLLFFVRSSRCRRALEVWRVREPLLDGLFPRWLACGCGRSSHHEIAFLARLPQPHEKSEHRWV